MRGGGTGHSGAAGEGVGFSRGTGQEAEEGMPSVCRHLWHVRISSTGCAAGWVSPCRSVSARGRLVCRPGGRHSTRTQGTAVEKGLSKQAKEVCTSMIPALMGDFMTLTLSGRGAQQDTPCPAGVGGLLRQILCTGVRPAKVTLT